MSTGLVCDRTLGAEQTDLRDEKQIEVFKVIHFALITTLILDLACSMLSTVAFWTPLTTNDA